MYSTALKTFSLSQKWKKKKNLPGRCSAVGSFPVGPTGPSWVNDSDLKDKLKMEVVSTVNRRWF